MVKRTFVIAEAGVNHNGSLDLALELVDAAASTGADAVKFQTFTAKRLATNSARMAKYQVTNMAREISQFEMLSSLELSEDAHKAVLERCGQKGIMFLSSPFDEESVRFLANTLRVKAIKVPSGEITNGPYLLAVAATQREVIMSTGMAVMDEVAQALDVLAWGLLGRSTPSSLEETRGLCRTAEGYSVLKNKVSVLHCTTEYPAAMETINLRAMTQLREVFGLTVGFSDHSEGSVAPLAAIALGAEIIEKHITLDRSMAGPDHKASMEPGPFKEMVRDIRAVELALGDGNKAPVDVELANRGVARKSLTAAVAMRKGEKFSLENLNIRRPGTGMSPMLYWALLGKSASRDYQPGDLIEEV